MNYIYHIFTMFFIYAILGLSLNLVLGYGGLLSLCHASFFGLGAYASALLMLKLNFPFTLAFVASFPIVLIFAILVGYPALRLKGDFFILGTTGAQVIIFSVLYNWVNLTEGPFGLKAIPRPFGISTLALQCLLAATLFLFTVWIFRALTHSPYGRALKCVREDEIAALTLGKNPAALRLSSFAISGAFAGLAGAFYASYITYIDPTMFTLSESIFILTSVIIGGAGSMKGPVLGAVIIVSLPEILRMIGIPDMYAANSRQILYGVILVILMRWRPQGIWGEYTYD